MHVDYLNITVPDPHNDLVRPQVLEIVGLCGGVRADMSRGKVDVYRLGKTGTVKLTEKDGYAVYGFSGDALATLRGADLYNEYLWIFALIPHRVTLLDIAYDVPLKTPRILRKLWSQAHTDIGIKFTRKKIATKSISTWSVIGLDGVKTGTLYLGSRKAEVRLKVYDKRQQVYDLTGNDIGALTRYELTVTSKMGISLADASDPSRLFWHFMANILVPPSDISPWEPGGEGFQLPPRVTMLPAEKLKRGIQASQDLDNWVRLAHSMGPNGEAYMRSLLDRAILDAQSKLPSQTTTEPLQRSKG